MIIFVQNMKIFKRNILTNVCSLAMFDNFNIIRELIVYIIDFVFCVRKYEVISQSFYCTCIFEIVNDWFSGITENCRISST